MTVDPFANPSGNCNGVVVGTSGSGKSVLLNELAIRMLGNGGRVWIIDVGRSYEKLCSILHGQYLQFSDSAHICLNPFSFVTDIGEEMELLKPLFAQMISPTQPLSDYLLANLDMHIRHVWEQKGKDSTISDLAESLKNNWALNPDDFEEKTNAEDAEQLSVEDKRRRNDSRVRELGVQLYPFTKEGSYGRYFDGPANVDFSSNFIVLELEELKARKDLQAVIMLLLMYRITNEMYLGDRKQKKLVIIDEAWDLFDHGNAGQFIEAGYRRARKYGGAFFTGTQSIADYYKSPAATAAFENADMMLLMRQKGSSVDQLLANKRVSLDERSVHLLRSLTTHQGMFSEVFVKIGDFVPAIGRLFLDPFFLLTASTTAEDFEDIKRHRQSGLSTVDAIDAVLRERVAASWAGRAA